MTTTTDAMLEVERATTIGAPLADVFAFYSDPENHCEIWPNLRSVTDVQRDGDHPTTWKWSYSLAGFAKPFHGTSVVKTFVPNSHIVVETEGGIDSTHEIEYRATSETETEVKETIRYHIPPAARLARGVIRRLNVIELKNKHENLKVRLEHGD